MVNIIIARRYGGGETSKLDPIIMGCCDKIDVDKMMIKQSEENKKITMTVDEVQTFNKFKVKIKTTVF